LIVGALKKLGRPCADWPTAVREFHERFPEHPNLSQKISPPPFRPPAVDRLSGSQPDRLKVVDEAYQQYRNDLLRMEQFWISVGVDDAIPAGKRTRAQESVVRTASGAEIRPWNNAVHLWHNILAECL
jgi:hypothetical protein